METVIQKEKNIQKQEIYKKRVKTLKIGAIILVSIIVVLIIFGIKNIDLSKDTGTIDDTNVDIDVNIDANDDGQVDIEDDYDVIDLFDTFVWFFPAFILGIIWIFNKMSSPRRRGLFS